jgi:hypothetical protein
MERKHGIPAGMIAAIARAETSYGKAGTGPSKYNAWGWMTGAGPPNQRGFANWNQAIRQYASFLGKNYIRAGYNTPEKMARRYVGSHSPTWLGNVNSTLRELGVAGAGPPTSAPGGGGGRGAGGRGGGGGRGAPSPLGNNKQIMKIVLAMLSMDESPDSLTMFLPFLLQGMQQPGVGGGGGRGHGHGGHRHDHPIITANGRNGVRLPTSFRSTHGTSGLAGYPAVDIMARGGTPVYAPVGGRISSSRPFGWLPTQNPAAGFGGARLYLEGANGKTYYIAHLAKNLRVRPGQRIKPGQLIGYVWDWPGDPGRSHIHIGVNG